MSLAHQMFRITAILISSLTATASSRRQGFSRESLLTTTSFKRYRLDLPSTADALTTSLLVDFATTGYNAAKLLTGHTHDPDVKHQAATLMRQYDKLMSQGGDEASKYQDLFKLGIQGRSLDITNFETQSSNGSPAASSFYFANLKRYASVSLHWLKLLRPHVEGMPALGEVLTRSLDRLETIKAQSFERLTTRDVRDAIKIWDDSLIAVLSASHRTSSSASDRESAEEEFFDAEDEDAGLSETFSKVTLKDQPPALFREARALLEQAEGVAIAFENAWSSPEAAVELHEASHAVESILTLATASPDGENMALLEQVVIFLRDLGQPHCAAVKERAASLLTEFDSAVEQAATAREEAVQDYRELIRLGSDSALDAAQLIKAASAGIPIIERPDMLKALRAGPALISLKTREIISATRVLTEACSTYVTDMRTVEGDTVIRLRELYSYKRQPAFPADQRKELSRLLTTFAKLSVDNIRAALDAPKLQTILEVSGFKGRGEAIIADYDAVGPNDYAKLWTITVRAQQLDVYVNAASFERSGLVRSWYDKTLARLGRLYARLGNLAAREATRLGHTEIAEALSSACYVINRAITESETVSFDQVKALIDSTFDVLAVVIESPTVESDYMALSYPHDAEALKITKLLPAIASMTFPDEANDEVEELLLALAESSRRAASITASALGKLKSVDEAAEAEAVANRHASLVTRGSRSYAEYYKSLWDYSQEGIRADIVQNSAVFVKTRITQDRYNKSLQRYAAFIIYEAKRILSVSDKHGVPGFQHLATLIKSLTDAKESVTFDMMKDGFEAVQQSRGAIITRLLGQDAIVVPAAGHSPIGGRKRPESPVVGRKRDDSASMSELSDESCNSSTGWTCWSGGLPWEGLTPRRAEVDQLEQLLSVPIDHPLIQFGWDEPAEPVDEPVAGPVAAEPVAASPVAAETLYESPAPEALPSPPVWWL